MGLITEPRLTLQIDKAAGYFNFEALTFGTVYVQKYRESVGDGTVGFGGNANPKYSVGGLVEAEFRMPFLEDLSIGIDAYTQYTWLYNVQNGVASTQTTCASCPGYFDGAIADQPSQPVQQEYGGEIFIHYYLPQVAGLKSDIALALAQGDPALGYSSVLHDGCAGRAEYVLLSRSKASKGGLDLVGLFCRSSPRLPYSSCSTTVQTFTVTAGANIMPEHQN